MEIKEFMFVVSSHYPLTNIAIDEHYYNDIHEARDCFNELCAEYPDVVVELGIMTLCKNPCNDSYRVIKTRRIYVY